MARRIAAKIESFLLEPSQSAERWYVYLFALTDCTAFKVGFSCNPLQRICTFSRRYFERFDLMESTLLEVQYCELARALEALLKTELAMMRADAPDWVPAEAGGHTEWFSAVYFGDAASKLRSALSAQELVRELNAFDLFRAQLELVRQGFESWAALESQRTAELWSYEQRGYGVKPRSTVRDWLDAYSYFDIPLFTDQPELLAAVRDTASLTRR